MNIDVAVRVYSRMEGNGAAPAAGEQIDSMAAALGQQELCETPSMTCSDFVGDTFIKGDRFQSFIALVILANAALIGLETDLPSRSWLWDIFENAFLFIFTVELALRLYFFGLSFFGNRDWIANWFDFLLVGAGLLDFTMTVIIHGSLGHFTTFIRLCRLLRIMRLFRLFKMFKQLYMLASGFADASEAVFWVSVLCALFLYVCAVFLARTMGQGEDTDAMSPFWKEKFGSIPTAMFTLFELMADPGHLRIMKAAMFANPGTMVFFIAYIIFGSFAMLSILTGVISEGMIQKGNAHKEELRFQEEREKMKFMEKLRAYFISADADGDGTMTREEFNMYLPHMIDMFSENGFNYSSEDLQMVFDLVDFDKGGTIELEEFLQGMTSFTGNVSDIPLQILRFQSNVFLHVDKLNKNLQSRMSGIQGKYMNMENRMKSIDDLLGNLIAKQRQKI